MYIDNLKGKYVQHLLSVDDMSEDFILEIWTNALKNKDTNSTIKEIIRMCRINKLQLYMKIKLKNSDLEEIII